MKNMNFRDLEDCIQSIMQGFFAVVATLKEQFCMAVTLGKSIGGMLEKPARKFVLPIFKAVIPGDHYDDVWGERLIKYAVNGIAVSFAFYLQTYISCVQAAMRGGLMAARGAMGYAVKMGWMGEINHEDTIMDEVVGYTLAFIGAYQQIMHQFALPFPLNILFFPATFAQSMLIWAMGINR